MARVTIEGVEHLARLAHLSLTDEERRTFARQLEEILAFAESIQALDTAEVPAMSHARPQGSFREDVPHASPSRARILEQAPDAEAGLFRVPRVIGG